MYKLETDPCYSEQILSKQQKGILGEAIVLCDLTARGYIVTHPFGLCPYDLIAEIYGKLYRVEVKYGDTTPLKNRYDILARVTKEGIKYTPDIENAWKWDGNPPPQKENIFRDICIAQYEHHMQDLVDEVSVPTHMLKEDFPLVK
jgi:PD-(D/E)XK endonuclease